MNKNKNKYIFEIKFYSNIVIQYCAIHFGPCHAERNKGWPEYQQPGRKTQHDSNKEQEDKDACESRKWKIKRNKFKYVNEKFKNYTRKVITCIENIIQRILLKTL